MLYWERIGVMRDAPMEEGGEDSIEPGSRFSPLVSVNKPPPRGRRRNKKCPHKCPKPPSVADYFLPTKRMDLLLFGTEKNFTEDDFLSLVEDTEQQYNVEGEQLLKEEQDYNGEEEQTAPLDLTITKPGYDHPQPPQSTQSSYKLEDDILSLREREDNILKLTEKEDNKDLMEDDLWGTQEDQDDMVSMSYMCDNDNINQPILKDTVSQDQSGDGCEESETCPAQEPLPSPLGSE